MIIRPKILLILACVVGLTFANSLKNGFIGDDQLLFVHNAFYKDPANLTKLVSKEFITNTHDLNLSSTPSGQLSISGCVAYRPVTALTFFADTFLWGSNPLGFHLTNILLHLFACYLIFLLVREINEQTALWTVLIFAVHPIQAELVNSIGYRSDFLMTIFGILAFRGWMTGRHSANFWFALALLSKETALMFPLLFVAYDLIIRQSSLRQFWQEEAGRIVGIVILSGIYLYLYGFVFRNSSLPTLAAFDFWHQVSLSSKALAHYLVNFLMPWTVGLIPGQYAPNDVSLTIPETMAFGAFIGFVVWSIRTSRYRSFFALWALIAFLPTSNLVPLPNPLAHRYLYLPMIGLCALMAHGLVLLGLQLRSAGKERLIRLLSYLVICGLLIGWTMPLNEYYRNDIAACRKMIERYRDALIPYMILGGHYRQAGKIEESRRMFEQALANHRGSRYFHESPNQAEIVHQLGLSHTDDLRKARMYFEEAVRIKPDFAEGYADLGRTEGLLKNYAEGFRLIEQAIRLQPRLYKAHVYGIMTALDAGDKARALRYWWEAKRRFPEEPMLDTYKGVIHDVPAL